MRHKRDERDNRRRSLHTPKHRSYENLNGKIPVKLREGDSRSFLMPVRFWRENGVLFVEPIQELSVDN